MENSLYSKVFRWLFLGLLLTFISGYYTMTNVKLLTMLFDSKGYIVVIILQLVLCISLSAKIRTMNPTTAKIIYALYSILTGLTFSSIFIMFDIDSIIMVFLATSIIFGIFGLIGKNMKMDLGRFGTYLFMGLLAIIVLEVINMFILNNTLNIVLASLGTLIFMGYIAYDMQKINSMALSNIDEDNIAIIGAFELYLDFINIFIRLLDLFGKERN